MNKEVLQPDVFSEGVTTSGDESDIVSIQDLSQVRASVRPFLIIEPFYGGSHRQLIDFLIEHLTCEIELVTLPAKKWHWRARTSALYLSQTIPKNTSYRVLFCSSVLNLAELCALRPDLSCLHKVVYFHENQLVYPVRKVKERDFQYRYNQVLSALVAETVVFNSKYNMDSFFKNVSKFLNTQPDCRVKHLEQQLIPKCQVIYFPVPMCSVPDVDKGNILHIIWPHRWEHDKNPELFFEVLLKLKQNNFNFHVSVLGEEYSEVPESFLSSRLELSDNIKHWGRLTSVTDYYHCLETGHVVVSTAIHEFFGVAVVEAVIRGCYPLVPNALVYPELYPRCCLYNTSNQLYKMLKSFCKNPYLCGQYFKKANIDVLKFDTKIILKQFQSVINI